MGRSLLLALGCFLIFALLLCSRPAAAFEEAQAGSVGPNAASALDHSQKTFAEALRSVDRERDYFAEKARYQQAVANRCAGEKWYDLGFLECALFVPLFGLILPFFGIMLVGAVRSLWRTSSAGAIDYEQTPPAHSRL